MAQNTFPLPPAASNPIFTFAQVHDASNEFNGDESLWSQHPAIQYAMNNVNDGVFCLDTVITDTTKTIAAACEAAGKPFILGYTDLGIRNQGAEAANMTFLAEALKLTDKLAIATSSLNEWSPITSVSRWTDFAAKEGFTWISTFIQVRMLTDMQGDWHVRDELIATSTPIFCLCGYMLSNYCLGQSLPTYYTSLGGDKNLAVQHRLSLPVMRAYLDPLYAISGAGGFQGMARGARRWSKQSGFDGVVFSGPATPAERDNMPAEVRPPNDLGNYEDLVDRTWG